MSEVKIRNLEWEPTDTALTTLGVRYSVYPEYGHAADRDGWAINMVDGFFNTKAEAKAAAQADFEARIRSSLLPDVSGAEAAGWQPIETAPKDGTPVDLWGVNHLHPAKTGRRATDVTWGPVRDWMGNEREDWQDGQGEDFEPTHWMPLPSPPLQTEGK